MSKVRRIATKQEKEAPHRNSISKWMKRFKLTNSAIDRLWNGSLGLYGETVDYVGEALCKLRGCR